MTKIKVTLTVLTLTLVSLFAAPTHAQDPQCPTGQFRVVIEGQCACGGATQGPPCKSKVGDNWKGAALGA